MWSGNILLLLSLVVAGDLMIVEDLVEGLMVLSDFLLFLDTASFANLALFSVFALAASSSSLFLLTIFECLLQSGLEWCQFTFNHLKQL